jgi:acetoin utilization deacetylase AcuC-like enzyme
VRQAVPTARAKPANSLAGTDPFVGDRLRWLAVTKEGLAQRDRMMCRHCRAAGLPVAVTMAGGYGREIEDTVGVQFQTVRRAAEEGAARPRA